ncbi:MFS transporter [Sphingomonas sp.]|uniref:MFS transporter n=1 Tax=Sphingomonas sp. TaxID=28214 RepID=UPI0031D110F7
MMRAIASFWRDLTLKSQGVTLVLVGFLPIFAIVAMFPVVASIIQHFSDEPDAVTKVPLMVTAPGLTIALLAPFAGLAVDRFGRRKLLILSTLAYGVCGVAPFFLDDLNHIFASRLMLGGCEAVILTVTNTLIADYWEDTGRRNWLFLQGFFGPFFASAVILTSGSIAALQWNAGFLIYLVAFPIVIAVLACIFEPGRSADAQSGLVAPPTATPHTPFPVALTAIVVVVTLVTSSLYYVFIVNGSIAFGELGVRNPAEVSRITFLPSLFVMLGAVFFRALAKRSNTVQLGAFLFIIGLGMAGIGLAQTLPQMIAAVIVQQTGAGMAVPTLIAWAQSKFPFEHRGRGMGAWTSAFFLGQFVSPWFVHQFAALGGSMQASFLICGCIAVVVSIGAPIAGSFNTRRNANRAHVAS